MSLLVSTIRVPAAGLLVPGAIVALPHGLNAPLPTGGNTGLVPCVVQPWSATNIIVNTADDTQVVFQNTDTAPAFAYFRCLFDHSIQAQAPESPLWWRGITGSTSPSGAAGGDLAGTYPNPKVVGFNTIPIDLTPPANGDALLYDSIANKWVHSPVGGGGGAPAGPAGGDLGGVYPNPNVVGFAMKPIDVAAPAAGDVWQFDGATWKHVPLSSLAIPAIYGSYANTDGPIVVPVAPLAPLAVAFDTIEGESGIFLDGGPGGTKLKVPRSGQYELSFSPQLRHSGGTASVVSMWLRLNGLSPVPRTNSDIRLANNNDTIFLYIAVTLTLTAGDYVEWLMSSSAAGPTELVSFAGSGGVGPNDRPLAPAVIASAKYLGS